MPLSIHDVGEMFSRFAIIHNKHSINANPAAIWRDLLEEALIICNENDVENSLCMLMVLRALLEEAFDMNDGMNRLIYETLLDALGHNTPKKHHRTAVEVHKS